MVAGEGVGETGEESGVLHFFAAGFEAVVFVVEADAEDLGGVGDDGEVGELAGGVVGGEGLGERGDAAEGLGGEEGAEVREGGADVAAEIEDAVGTSDAVGGAAFCDEAYVGHVVPCSRGGRIAAWLFDGKTLAAGARCECVLRGVGGDFYPASFEGNG